MIEEMGTAGPVVREIQAQGCQQSLQKRLLQNARVDFSRSALGCGDGEIQSQPPSAQCLPWLPHLVRELSTILRAERTGFSDRVTALTSLWRKLP